MSNLKSLDKYEKINQIYSWPYGEIFRAKNKLTGNYVAIQKIDKSKFENENKYLSIVQNMKILKSENSVSFIEAFNTKDNFYIVMELCLINLEEYMKIRNEELSIQELKEILIQLNKIIKKMNEENIIHRDLKLSNILISVNKINKISFKLCNFNLSKNTNLKLKNNKNILTIAPEIIKEGNINNKNDIWSLGVIIYYLLFKEYPYNGETELQLNQDIYSGKKLKKSNNNELNDLINKMICIDLNYRISWDDYFNHPFFQNTNNYPQFEFNCKIHSKIIKGYCSSCKNNICEGCLNAHSNHNIIPLNKIGMSKEEISKSEKFIREIEINIKNMNKIKDDIISFLNKIQSKNGNNVVFQNNDNNNFINYYIEYLNIISDKSKIEGNLKIIDFDQLKLKNINQKIEIELYIY